MDLDSPDQLYLQVDSTLVAETAQGERPPKPKKGSARSRDDNALGKFSKWVRLNITTPPAFNNFILLLILVNCFFLAWNDPERFLAVEYICTIIFILEMIIKFVALGFWGHYKDPHGSDPSYEGYFNDAWNILDFIIVASSISIFFGSSGSGAVRALRIFRPLRVLSRSAEQLVSGMYASLEGLMDVVLLLGFLMVCFAIFAVQLFSGALHRRCFEASVSPELTWRDWDSDLYGHLTNDQFCSKVTSHDCSITTVNGEFVFGNQNNCPSSSCPASHPLCLEIAPNPNEKVNSWDNFYMALLNIFWIISLEQWVNSMYMLQDAYSPYVWLFFYIVTAVVAFFALNLCLAVIEEGLDEAGEDAEEEESGDKFWDKELFEKIYPDSTELDQKIKDSKTGNDIAIRDSVLSKSENIMSGQLGRSYTDRYKIKVTAQEYLEELYEKQQVAFKTARKAWLESYIEHSEYLEGKNHLILCLNSLVCSSGFNSLVIFCIIANTIVLALVWPNQSDKLKDDLEICNGVFTWFFFVEMILKILGLGVRDYWIDNWNRFDACIVVISVMEFFIVLAGGGAGGVFSAFRGLRVLRAFRVVRNEKLQTILQSVLDSLTLLFYLVIIFGVFLFILIILGITIFAEKWGDLEEPEDIHTFNGFYEAFLTVFQVITGDNWNGVMVEAVSVTSMEATLYFIGCLCFGSFVLLNLFIAILLSRLEDQGEERWTAEDAAQLAAELRQTNLRDPKPDEYWLKMITQQVLRRRQRREFKKKFNTWKEQAHSKTKMLGKSFWYFRDTHPLRIWMHKVALNQWFTAAIDLLILVACVLLAIETPSTSDDLKFRLRICDYVFTSIFVIEMLMKMVACGVLPTRIFYDHDWDEVHMGPLEQRDLEKECGEVVKKMKEEDDSIKLFDIQPNVIYKIVESNDGWRVVLFSKSDDMRLVFLDGSFHTAFLSNDDTRNGGPHKWIQWGMREGADGVQDGDSELKYGKRIHRLDVRTVCESVHCDEINHNSYFSSNWNLLDFMVVVFSVLGLMFEDLSIFRVLRAIRPLRIAIRIHQVKIILSALIKAIPSMISTLSFVCLVWFVVAILGTYFLSGKMYSCGCDVEDVTCADWVSSLTEATCTGQDELFTWVNNQCACLESTFSCETVLGDVATKADCLAHGDVFSWSNALWNFDNVFASTHTLFVMATLSGWAGTMYEGINAVGVDMQPVEWNNKWLGIYFVIAIIICSFFSLNLIVSVVVDNFNRIKREKDGSAFLTTKQQRWVRTKQLSNSIGLTMKINKPAEGTIYMAMFNIVEHKFFEPFILGCIVVNVSLMCTLHYDMSDSYETFLYFADLIFIIIFTLEAILKLMAYGPRVYFNDDWNKFDFAIVLFGIISLMEFITVGLNVIRLFRLFRIGRAFRLINNVKKLKTLFLTLLYSLPALWNIGLLIFVIMFIYAVIGVGIFGEDVCEDECADENDDLVDKVNFSNFFLAMNLLYRVSTEDGWTDLYGAFVELHSPSWEVYLYFTTFFIFGTLVLWNLFIAVILDRFDDNKELILQQEHLTSLESWRDEWKEFDPYATGTIPAEDFIQTLLKANSPAGLDGAKLKDLDKRTLMEFLNELRLVAHDNDASDPDNVVDMLHWCFKFFCMWSEETALGGWVVRYDEASIALTNKILVEKGATNVPIDLEVHEGEQMIADWYARDNQGLRRMLTDIKLDQSDFASDNESDTGSGDGADPAPGEKGEGSVDYTESTLGAAEGRKPPKEDSTIDNASSTWSSVRHPPRSSQPTSQASTFETQPQNDNKISSFNDDFKNRQKSISPSAKLFKKLEQRERAHDTAVRGYE